MSYFEKCQHTHPVYSQRGPKSLRNLDSYRDSLLQAKLFFGRARSRNEEEWTYSFYLGKIAYKLRENPQSVLEYFRVACSLARDKLEPFYRLHATRLKYLLFTEESCVSESLMNELKRDMYHKPSDPCEKESQISLFDDLKYEIVENMSQDAKTVLRDCLIALERCLEVAHYYKARYTLAKAYAKLGDKITAFKTLSFIFKNKAGSFDLNAYEIGEDIVMKKEAIRLKQRKQLNIRTSTGKVVEIVSDDIKCVGVEEPSRKYVSAIRRISIFYLRLACELGEYDVLESASSWIRSDRSKLRHVMEDIGPLIDTMRLHALHLEYMSIKSEEVADQDDQVSSVLCKCFDRYVDAYKLHTDVWRYFSDLASNMDFAIGNKEIVWFTENQIDAFSLSAISIENFLLRASLEYILRTHDRSVLLSLVSRFHEFSPEKLEPFFAREELLMLLIDRLCHVLSYDIQVAKQGSTNNEGRSLEDIFGILQTTKSLREYCSGNFAKIIMYNNENDDVCEKTDYLKWTESLLQQAYRLYIKSTEADNNNLSDSECHLEEAILFCESVLESKQKIKMKNAQTVSLKRPLLSSCSPGPNDEEHTLKRQK